ncbi:glycosyltransferase family 4 protein [uncultured Friedmanniella sp.]|uniref:glycosyltransferase family 4 protein n=1 Tax=uncultured Friedmanniella sp. TaxID=335381 RepID=UPI0035CB19F4
MRIAEVLGASTGGIGRHVASLVPRLVAQGHEVTVYCPPVTVLAHDFGAARVEALRHLPDVARVDVVHAHGYQAGVRALPWARLGRTPLVVTWHNAILSSGALLGSGRHAVAGRLLQELVARGADLTLGASSDLVETARACGARRAELGPVAAPTLPAPTIPRSTYRASLGLEDADRLLVTVGRLAPQKNLGMVLDLAAFLGADPRLRFAIAGDGPLHDELDRRVRAEGLPVRLLGRCDDVASLLGAADGVLLTSTWEARALVAQEALLAGVPLFSTRVGGIPELVGDAAVLFPLDDVSGAAALIRAVLEDPDRLGALREAGLQRAARWPDEDRVAEDLGATYAALVTEHAAGHSTRGRRPT